MLYGLMAEWQTRQFQELVPREGCEGSSPSWPTAWRCTMPLAARLLGREREAVCTTWRANRTGAPGFVASECGGNTLSFDYSALCLRAVIETGVSAGEPSQDPEA
jgi:hypothetical protein